MIVNQKSYNKKLPISFISPKDWQKYLNFTNTAGCSSSKKNARTGGTGENGRVFRLLNSFHMLYKEYSMIFDSSVACISDSGHGSTISQPSKDGDNDTKTIVPGENDAKGESEKNVKNVSIQTCLSTNQTENVDMKGWTTSQSNSNMDLENPSPVVVSPGPWKIKKIISPTKKISQRLKEMVSFSQKRSLVNHSKFFDKITKLENNIAIEVIEEVHKQQMVCHSLSFVNVDMGKFQIPKMKYLQIPLAIELLLPKIQLKIENILHSCPFLCDPLEVAAELRQFGYDEENCINYFKITKNLRSIIEDIVPENNININCLVNNDIHGTTNVPSTLSSSHRPMIKDSKYESGDMMTAFNSNGNHYVSVAGDNIKSSNRVSFEGDSNGNNELCSYVDNAADIVKFSRTGRSPSTDCMTQTCIVHFYMDDKSMESIFYKIKHYLAIVRQLHLETKDEIEYLHKQLSCVFTSLKSHMALLINRTSNKTFSEEQKTKIFTLSRQVEELKLKLKKEEKKRRHAYNLMQEQMGNIRVYCRCRQVPDGGGILEFLGNETIVLSIAPNERFEFDKVFHPGTSQVDLYEEFRPLVMSFIDGYNVCFITYGGEASGKTYTLVGGDDGSNQQGLMQRALTTILLEERLRQRDCEYKITACVVEVYNDNCIDVLSGETNIQLYVDNGMETAYHKLKSVPITNEADVEALMHVCKMKRKVARTALNPASSRSHLITLLRLQGRSKIHGENICSFLCLCDLAGFEDIIKAETQANKVLSKEAGYINKSLTAFNRVFVSLKKQDPNTVSYRDTKLTHLLKPFLTNSGKCALIITVRNDKRSLGSTQNTLRFGRETRGVSLGKARRQVNLNGQVSVM